MGILDYVNQPVVRARPINRAVVRTVLAVIFVVAAIVCAGVVLFENPHSASAALHEHQWAGGGILAAALAIAALAIDV